jgi:hypothetical protein
MDEPNSPPTPAHKGFCLRCQQNRDLPDAEIVTLRNGRTALKGRCPLCFTSIFKLIAKEPKLPLRG